MLRRPDRSALVAAAAGALLAFGAIAILLIGVVIGGHPSRYGLTHLPDPLRGFLVGEAAGGRTAEVLEILERDYYREIDRDALDGDAIDQIVAALDDPYTDYLTAEEYAALQRHNDGRYSGIGVQVSGGTGAIEIVAVTPGGPAAKAGLRVGDRIVAVEGRPVDGNDLGSASDRIRGPEGTSVTITVRRSGASDRRYTLTRASIEVELITARILRVDDAKVGHLRLLQFARGSADELRERARALRERGATAFVLDLRSNPGGLLNEAVELSAVFLAEGTPVVTTDGRSVSERTLSTTTAPEITEPVVVLVDRASASSSEIVAGALRDADRARLVGQRTFGKALVQSTRPLRGGDALKLTIARYLTPSGLDINAKGLSPDIVSRDDPETRADEALLRAAAAVSDGR